MGQTYVDGGSLVRLLLVISLITLVRGDSAEQIVNDVIVLTTATILLVAAIAWTLIIVIRVLKLKTESNKLLSQTNIDELTSDGKKKKKPKNKSKQGSVTNEETKSVVSESAFSQSEQTYLLDTPETRAAAENLRLMLRESSTANQKTKAKQALSVKAMFTLVMSDGMTLTLHTAKGTKPINMVLVGKEVMWKTAKLFAKKRSKLHMLDIARITQGKQTDNFRLPPATNVPDDNCFSIITKENVTIDLQVTSKVERDAIVQGFLALMQEAVEEAKATKTGADKMK